MKKLILLLGLLSIRAFATNEIDFITGSATYHIIDPTNYGAYGPSFTSNGRGILNAVVALRYTYYRDDGVYWSVAGMAGQNSIFQPIYGGMYSRGYHYKYIDLGVIAGGYIQDDTEFTKRGLANASIGYGSHALVAGIGVEANLNIPLDDHWIIRENNIIMPLIINVTLGLGYKY